jgi:MerR family transcriptional regulator, light-induced transcriptional regulator
MQQILLSTSEFAAAIGVSESSVRRMADSGELLIHRTRGGHRRIPAAEAIRYVRENDATIVRPDLLGLVEGLDKLPSQDHGARLIHALSEGHAKSVIGLMQAMYASGMPIAEICDGPIHQAMTAIGNSWPHDKRAIFVEHRATLLCVRALCQIRLSLTDPNGNAPTAMGAAPTDDYY